MKKFFFSLQKILDYNRHIQKNEENILKEMRNNLDGLCYDKAELSNIYDYYIGIYTGKCEMGIQISEIAVYKSYITQIHGQIEELGLKIEEANREIDEQIKKVLLATREKTSLERLKDKHFEEYRSQERKEEEIFINEFIVSAAACRTGAAD